MTAVAKILQSKPDATVYTIAPSASVLDALTLMADKGIGALLATEGEAIVGIFTSITSFVAWYMGAQAKKEIEAGAPYEWGGQLKTGYTLGKVFSIIWIVMWSLIILLYVVMFGIIFAVGM